MLRSMKFCRYNYYLKGAFFMVTFKSSHPPNKKVTFNYPPRNESISQLRKFKISTFQGGYVIVPFPGGLYYHHLIT